MLAPFAFLAKCDTKTVFRLMFSYQTTIADPPILNELSTFAYLHSHENVAFPWQMVFLTRQKRCSSACFCLVHLDHVGGISRLLGAVSKFALLPHEWFANLLLIPKQRYIDATCSASVGAVVSVV